MVPVMVPSTVTGEPVQQAGLDCAEPAAGELTIVEPSTGWVPLRIAELWRYRELIGFLIWRDVTLRYKQTTLGVAWAVLQPMLTMVVFSVFFGRLAAMPSDGVPYPLFSLAALVPWTLFSFALTQATASVVASQHLITKVYFPRLAIPVAAVLSGLVDFVLAFTMLLLLMIAYGVAPTIKVAWIPLFTALLLVCALGVGFLLSALNVQYRDVRYVLPFLTQIWLFMTPVAYPSSLLHEPWRTLYGINPMAGVVEGFRWALLGTPPPPLAMTLVSAAVSAALLVGGAFAFRRMERTFADVV